MFLNHSNFSGQVEVEEAVLEDRALTEKEWSRYAYRRHRDEIWRMDRIIISQQRALDELRDESEELYLAAIKMDENLFPAKHRGPTRTPAIPNYLQDGEYHEISKQYQVQYPDMKAFMNQLIVRKKRKKTKTEQEDDDY